MFDSPTGAKQSSPNVCSIYASNSHVGATSLPLASTSSAANTMTRNPRPSSSRPKPNFSGAEGSRLRLPSATQSQAKNGANSTMQIGLIDWYHDAGCTPSGNSPPSTDRSV